MPLADKIEQIKGIGAQSAHKLHRLGIYTQLQLLLYLPIKYQNKTQITSLSKAMAGESILVQLTIDKIEKTFGNKKQLLCYLSDDYQRKLLLRFFHWNEFQAGQLKRDQVLQCFGEVVVRNTGLEMVHPQYRILSLNQDQLLSKTLTPVYSATLGIAPARLSQWIKQTLLVLEGEKPDDVLSDCQPGMLNFSAAIACLHYPQISDLDKIDVRQHPAQKRLILDEFCAKNLRLLQLKQQREQQRGYVMSAPDELNTKLKQQLSFELTGAQQRAIEQIQQHLSKSSPMLRLVQGDVGSGKTIVAVFSCLSAIHNGYQVAIMVPTEILARQHLKNIANYLTPLSIKSALLVASQNTKERKDSLALIKSGQANVIIGTHSLFQESVEFLQLGLVIIDEQHKFGVHQRLLLGQKSKLPPHQLIMTATPIPRSLMMSVYADLDTSIIDELPANRQAIATIVLSTERKAEVMTKITQVCKQGQQVYWVCTLVEDCEELPMQSATATLSELELALPDLRIGLVHGKLKKLEKRQIMQDFHQKKIDVLIATTVIEVGVDVPNANLMVIENAERLGLAQLHQLRGRVGRGSAKSVCILMYQKPLGQNAKTRLDILRRSNDGFLIAQKDLELRGAGEILGVAQTGERNFRIANPLQDQYLLTLASQLSPCLLRLPSKQQAQLTNRWHDQQDLDYGHT